MRLLWLSERKRERGGELNDDYKMARVPFQRRQGTSCRQAHDRRKLTDGESCEVQLIYCLCQPSDNRGGKKSGIAASSCLWHETSVGCCAMRNAFVSVPLLIRWEFREVELPEIFIIAFQCFLKRVDIVCSHTQPRLIIFFYYIIYNRHIICT